MSIDFDWLEKNVLKRTLTPEERNALKCMKAQTYNAWEKIIEQNQPGGTLYIFRSGVADVEDNNGQDRVSIANIKEGSMFGGMSFMSDEKTTAEVITKEPSEVYQISRDDFSNLMRNHQDLAYSILCRLLNNQATVIREMNSQLLPTLHNLAKKANSLPLIIKLLPVFFIIIYILAFFNISWKTFSY
ncbi:MAG: cyclic nucleotide-binding domain-containing protein [Mariprofundaceae bacterium]